MSGFICSPRIYQYDGWTFEYHQTSVWPLKNNGEPRKHAGRKFYKMLGEFTRLSDAEKQEHRVGGGCVAI